MEKVDVKFVNRSGQSRRAFNGQLSYTDDGFQVEYEQVREERSVDAEGVAVIKKIKTPKVETIKNSEIQSLTRAIPYGSFGFSLVILIALIIILVMQNSMEWYMIVLAILIPALIIFDTYREVRQVLNSISVHCHNQVVFNLVFRSGAQVADFKQKAIVTPIKQEE